MRCLTSVFACIITTSILSFHTFGQQNLVPNSSFEEYTKCPSLMGGFNLSNCKYWKSPTDATPDYFNTCSMDYDANSQTYQYSVPQNYYGYQEAHSGEAYGAFVFIDQTSSNLPFYSEYLHIELIAPLESGKFYKVSFFVNNARTNYCINSLGALFTASEISTNNLEIIPQTPQIISDSNTFFFDTARWQEVKGIFRANGNEKYLTIGVFKQLPELSVVDYRGNPQNTVAGYMYIDDVSVIEAAPSEIPSQKAPTIFTPNGDGINDILFLPFQESIADKKVSILNRWGNQIYEAAQKDFKWDGKNLDGSECGEGTYFYRISDVNISGFVQLIR